MGRYRPPAEKGSPYITVEGMTALQQELDYLWNKRRPLVVKALSAAAAEGDRSENAEYIYRKKELGEIDRRVRYLSKRVDELKVVSDTPQNTGQIF
ncbi:MAG TPA: transcription elongation factor GreB, partial [Gammaproteobacteria bacterium]